MAEYSGKGIDPGVHRLFADVSRVAVLEAVRGAGRPMAVREIAEAVGLHANTVRAHLALLAERGYVVGAAEDRERPGRPRLLYTAPPDRDEKRNYRLLAETLVAYLAEHSGDRTAAAIAAGRVYGERAVRQEHPLAEVTGEAAVRTVVEILDDIGFEPRRSADGRRVDLHRCPFRELAESSPEVVCGVHLGIMRGALAELGAPVEAVNLEPFVEPDRCVANLRAR
ncbi:helix-turn-helix transcriptional regulator [Actinorugispora endophytica]|uniref:helix-turn-helix transcriptional regulator n=1 Tax=Actinorugispora endophytica TaxID=1605990 RepID=UPI00105C71CA|nr:helix-turn-helix domain-containing protein [Actinorugispora endophytica]